MGPRDFWRGAPEGARTLGLAPSLVAPACVASPGRSARVTRICPLAPGFRTALADLRIDAPALSAADAVDIVVTDERRSYRDLHEALLSAGVRVNFELAPDGSNLQRGPVEHALLPRGSIDAVARALSDSQRGGA